MNNKNKNNIKSAFGNTLSDIPMIKIAIHRVLKDEKCYIYEICKDLGFKDWNGKPKYVFKAFFGEQSKFVEEKLNYLETLANNKEVVELPYLIREKNGRKYLNIILSNSQYEQK